MILKSNMDVYMDNEHGTVIHVTADPEGFILLDVNGQAMKLAPADSQALIRLLTFANGLRMVAPANDKPIG